ncbi:MAG: hypothetical protein OXC69_03955 [Candidatus Tectomicrobia bacterium]|nr:hypothetical protein [Candidatus Tectomicrobia bacterium]
MGQHHGFEIVETRLAQTLDVTGFKMAKENSSRVGVVCQRRTKLAIGPGSGYVQRWFDEDERQLHPAIDRFELVPPAACEGRRLRQQEERYVSTDGGSVVGQFSRSQLQVP